MVSENRRCFQILSVTEPESASTQGIPPRAGSDNIAASCGRGRAVNSESVARCVGHMSRKMPLILLLASNMAGAQPAPAPVVVEQVVIASALDHLALTGTATARRTSSISPYSEGLVIDMRVDVGDMVAEGQVLARLDGVIAGHELTRAGAALDEARAELSDAIRRRDEAARVHADNLIAASTYESAVADADIQQAVVARLEAEFARQQEIVRRYTVRAPFAGVIAQKFAEVGQWVQRSQALFELVDAEVLRVDVPVPQAYFASVGVGTPATVRFDAQAGKPIEAVVTTRVPIGDPAARTFVARLEIDNSKGEFAPGMSVRVALRPGDEQWGPPCTCRATPCSACRMAAIDYGWYKAAMMRPQPGRPRSRSSALAAASRSSIRALARARSSLATA